MNGNADKDAGVEGTLRRALDSGKSAFTDMSSSVLGDDDLKSETESLLEESSFEEETVYTEENINDDTFDDASQSSEPSGSSYDEVTVCSDEDTGREKVEDSAESDDLPHFFTPPSDDVTDKVNTIDIPTAEASNKEDLFILPETDNEAGSLADNNRTGDDESEFTEETVSGNEECDGSFNTADVCHQEAAEDESEFSEETVTLDDGSEFTEETVSGDEKISDIKNMVQNMAISETPAMTLSSEGDTEFSVDEEDMPLSVQHNLQVSEEHGSITGWGTMDTKNLLTHICNVVAPSEKSLTTMRYVADTGEEESQAIPVQIENDLQINVAEPNSDIQRVKWLTSFDQLAPPKTEPSTADEIIRANQKPPIYQKIDWTEASPDIEELLKGVTGSSLPRRTNACGAINVLVSTETKRYTLARTKGLLDALAFAASERVPKSQIAVALDGRIRAVEAILHLAELKTNRKLIFSHKGTVQSLLRVLKYGPGQARVHACKTFALLAKNTENRVGMINEDELVAQVTLVLSGKCDYNAVGIVLENEEDGYDSLGEGIGTYTFDDTSVLSFNQFHSAITEDWYSQDESSYDSQDDSQDESSYESSDSDDISDTLSANDQYETEYSNSYLDTSTIPTFGDRDDKYEKYLSLAKMNACAILMHLSNNCAASHALGRNKTVVETLVSASLEFDNPLHTKCIEILCNLTRFRPNISSLAQDCDMVTALVKCAQSKVHEDSMWSLRSIQNLTTDPSARKILATPTIVSILTAAAMQTDSEGQPAAVGALFNLCSDHHVIGPITNTQNMIVTLIHLTHSPSSNSDIREMASGSLASIASCLQTLAACATVPEGVPTIKSPSHTAVGWERWDGQ